MTVCAPAMLFSLAIISSKDIHSSAVLLDESYAQLSVFVLLFIKLIYSVDGLTSFNDSLILKDLQTTVPFFFRVTPPTIAPAGPNRAPPTIARLKPPLLVTVFPSSINSKLRRLEYL